MAKDTTTKVLNAWSKSINPLRGLTQTGISNLIDQLKYGNDVRLQIAFKQIEMTMPIFGVCINKRLAGITNRRWDIIPIDESKEAKNQAKFISNILKKSDTRNLDGLTECLRHLGLASFRGRSVVKPFFDDNNELYFKKIENWNTIEWNDKLYWNPTADETACMLNKNGQLNIDLKELTNEEVVWIKEERPIDIPGLQIYLRALVGEDNWSRATEKYGVAQVVIKAPEGTPDTALDIWRSRAISIFEGGSGVLPAGTEIETLAEARGQDPFSLYVQHQQEMIVLLALGEKLTTLGGATGLGSNLADIQNQALQNLITYDCKRISNAMTACVVKKCVKKFMPNQKILCRFEFIEKDNTTPEQYLTMAQNLHNMGISIDVQKLKEITNISFIADNQKDIWTPKSITDETKEG